MEVQLNETVKKPKKANTAPKPAKVKPVKAKAKPRISKAIPIVAGAIPLIAAIAPKIKSILPKKTVSAHKKSETRPGVYVCGCGRKLIPKATVTKCTQCGCTARTTHNY